MGLAKESVCVKLYAKSLRQIAVVAVDAGLSTTRSATMRMVSPSMASMNSTVSRSPSRRTNGLLAVRSGERHACLASFLICQLLQARRRTSRYRMWTAVSGERRLISSAFFTAWLQQMRLQ